MMKTILTRNKQKEAVHARDYENALTKENASGARPLMDTVASDEVLGKVYWILRRKRIPIYQQRHLVFAFSLSTDRKKGASLCLAQKDTTNELSETWLHYPLV